MQIEPFELERWMTTYETRVQYDIAESGILPLSVGDLLQWEEPADREESLRRLVSLPLGYCEASGTLALRSALAETYSACGPDQILVTTGAIEANFLLFHALLRPGDHVVAPFPAYQQLYSVPRSIGCDVALWRVRPETGFRYDVAELERLIRPDTRLVVINSPHNPTGAMLSDSDLDRVLEIARSVGATVLSDEAYRWLAIPSGELLPGSLFDRGPGAVSVGTLSKPFGLPGLRIGWMAAPADTVRRCWGLRDYVSLSPGKLNDALALLALKHKESIFRRNGAIISANLAVANAWVASHRDLLEWTPPRGGLLALLRYRLDIPSAELAGRLADEYGVMLAPGSAFGLEHCLRIGIGQEPRIFAAALDRVSDCLEAVARVRGTIPG